MNKIYLFLLLLCAVAVPGLAKADEWGADNTKCEVAIRYSPGGKITYDCYETGSTDCPQAINCDWTNSDYASGFAQAWAAISGGTLSGTSTTAGGLHVSWHSANTNFDNSQIIVVP